MSLLGVHALLVENAELFCKRQVYSLPCESNGRWTLTAYSHYTQHQFFPPSAGVTVKPCNGITKDAV